MREISECEECKTWEEEMYWTHFNSIHFFLTLPPNFHHHLVLPQKFASHMKVQLPHKVSLKAPSGDLWKVDVLKTDDILFVGNEWNDFVKANKVKEDSLLMFKYDRNSSFEVLIFDQESCCESECSYFLKKCRHSKSDGSDHDDKTTEAIREASSTEIIEDVNEEDFVFVESKKCRKDDDQEGGSGLKNTQSPLKNVLDAAAKCRDIPSKPVPTHKSTTKPKVQARKRPIGNKTGKKRKQTSPRDVITPEKGESLPKLDHPRKLMARYKKSSNKKAEAVRLSHDTRELINSNNSENSHILKDQSENQPARDDIASEPSPHIIENKDNLQTTYHSCKSKNRFEKNPNLKELSQSVGKELIIHENGEKLPFTDCFHRVNVQAGKGQSASSNVKEATPISWRAPDDIEISPEEDHSQKTDGKSGRKKKKGLHDSLKKSVVKNVSSEKKCSGEIISNRRPVTEEEKESALQRANQKETENSFTAIMRPTSVYRRFFLNIPSKWPQKHLLQRHQDVILRVREKTWLTTFTAYGSGLGLYNGWKRFALDNNLEEYDVLVFTPVNQEVKTAIVMDVEIFRVV